MPKEYVIITPARNEADFIEKTLRSMTSQTHLPKRWVIVSDGSTDATDDLVRQYIQGRDWIELIHLPEQRARDFAAKVQAFSAGYAQVKHLSFDVIGNLDADISFGEDYFEFLMSKFEAMPKLGVAGTHYVEDGFHSYDDSYINIQHVNGGCQLFRRECFDEIGGYVPIKGGGVDWMAVTTARMKGWTTYSFGERVFLHHRPLGTAGGNQLIARFKYGKKDYFLGGHPLWEICRGAFQMTKKPYVIGGLCILLGYGWCWLMRCERPISQELMEFHRREQLGRLREALGSRVPFLRRERLNF